MARLILDKANSIYYEWNPPAREDGPAFVFFNDLIADRRAWTDRVAPALEARGYGSLVFNYRGQPESTFSSQVGLDDKLTIADAISLLAQIKPARPILVGLSNGGLFAARSVLNGAEATGLVLINTLRRTGPRLAWLNDALVRATEVGGLKLLRDLYLPLLMNQDWLEANRDGFLTDDPYLDLDPISGAYKLLSEAGVGADWDLAYEKLDLPVLVVTGLQDRLFYDEADVADLFARLPRAKRVNLARAGYMIPAERPEELISLLAGFAQEL